MAPTTFIDCDVTDRMCNYSTMSQDSISRWSCGAGLVLNSYKHRTKWQLLGRLREYILQVAHIALGAIKFDGLTSSLFGDVCNCS